MLRGIKPKSEKDYWKSLSARFLFIAVFTFIIVGAVSFALSIVAYIL